MKNLKSFIIKSFSSLLIFAQVFLLSAPIAHATTIVDNTESMDLEGKHINKVYSTAAVTDINTLEVRAEQNIDDLFERRGISFDVAVDAPAQVNTNVKYTTQLVSAYEIDGHVQEEYVVTAVTELVTDGYNYTTKNGYKLVSSVWFYWNDYDHTSFKCHETTAYYTVVGTVTSSVSNMQMWNNVYTGHSTGYNYENGNGFASPSANVTYRLASPYSGWVQREFGSGIYSDVCLRLNDGTEIYVTVSGADGTVWYQ